MALSNKKKEASKEEKRDYEVKVTRAHELDNCVMFDMEVNGVTIYGCNYKSMLRKDGSGEFIKIGFPSRKGSDGKWYSQAYFKISDELAEEIEAQIDKLI